MINITTSKTEKSFQSRISYIDKLSYKAEDCVSQVGAEKSRLSKVPETFTFLKDNNQIMGYVEWFPITDKLKGDIEQSKSIIDNEITGCDIGWPKQGQVLNIFVLSVVILPGYGIMIRRLLNSVIAEIHNNIKKHSYSPGKLYAYGVSDSGNNLMSKMGMTLKRKVVGGILYEGDLISVN